METKICSKCGRKLPLDCFSKCKSKKDGLQSYCKECRKQYDKQYYAEHKEEKAAYDKQYKADNSEHLKEYFKQYYAEHTDYFKQRYATIERYAYMVRYSNLRADRDKGRCEKDEDLLPSLDYYIWALQQRDFYDGKQYHWSEMGLDRIYNDKPHTFANVVPCSTANNIRRQKMSFDEFCELMRREKEELELALN